MKPFYIDGLTASAYHAAPGIGSSAIRLLPDEPLTFRNEHTCRRCRDILENCRCDFPLCEPHKETPQMALGTAVHRVLLDGAEILVIPPKLLTKGLNRPTGKNELPLLEWEAEHRDAVHVMSENSPVHRMVASVRKHPKIGPIIRDPKAIKERSIWWVDKATGLLCKARIDFWLDGYIPDLKTTKAPRPGQRDFAAEIAYRELHRQNAWYWEAAVYVGMDPKKTGFIAVGNAPSYECWRHNTPNEALDLGYSQNVAARRELKDRMESGNWYPEGYEVSHETGPSEWYMRKHE